MEVLNVCDGSSHDLTASCGSIKEKCINFCIDVQIYFKTIAIYVVMVCVRHKFRMDGDINLSILT